MPFVEEKTEKTSTEDIWFHPILVVFTISDHKV